jgi:hypothetical protein
METALEHLLTHSYKADLISHMNSHPEDFGELLALAIADTQPYSWRAAWLLWSCMEKDDPRVRRHVGRIIEALAARPDNQVRELLNILLRMHISGKYEGMVFDRCMTIWESIGKQPSVRSCAFKLLVLIAKRHPELKKELIFLTEPHYTGSLSAGVRHSVLRMKSTLG